MVSTSDATLHEVDCDGVDPPGALRVANASVEEADELSIRPALGALRQKADFATT